MKKEKKFETVEAQKIYEIQNISSSLKENIEETIGKKGISSSLYTVTLLNACAAAVHMIKDGANDSFRLSAYLGGFTLLCSILMDLSARKAKNKISDDYSNLKNVVAKDKSIFTTEDRKSANSVKKLISKLTTDSSIIASLEGISIGTGAYLGALGLTSNAKDKGIVLLVALADILIGLGCYTLNKDNKSRINRKVDVLEDLMEKPYTLIRK